jgi:hypothetical protein
MSRKKQYILENVLFTLPNEEKKYVVAYFKSGNHNRQIKLMLNSKGQIKTRQSQPINNIHAIQKKYKLFKENKRKEKKCTVAKNQTKHKILGITSKTKFKK